jgi:hypothetical protein
MTIHGLVTISDDPNAVYAPAAVRARKAFSARPWETAKVCA